MGASHEILIFNVNVSNIFWLLEIKLLNQGKSEIPLGCGNSQDITIVN